ncbi:hypothetical protein RHGRI_033323 [Rhododendron griersonianum]|uniref:NB-ARC domain-containing protein n=1 Tax=Rhododendron griersonianum TaxID=479676 RepID=A0AAV6HW89_9ERIC|nr:hypothetical protein RHGRI_033323 [Rhododendron griersonianum]
MGTDAKVPVSVLPNEEAWEMFSSGVGHVAMLSTIKPYAQDIVTECGGLPLALKVVCSALRKEENVNVWRNFLRKLRSPATSIIEDLNENVFKVLKALDDQGETILQALIDASLMEKCVEDDSVKMHDVIQDLVLAMTSLQGEEPTHLVRAGISSEMIPEEVEWKNVTRISFMNHGLCRLPESPDCLELLTLLRQGNDNLEVIPETFFNNMPSLRVLDLSRTCIKLLPTSISKLEGLPKEISALKELEVLYVGRSKLEIAISGMKSEGLIILLG